MLPVPSSPSIEAGTSMHAQASSMRPTYRISRKNGSRYNDQSVHAHLAAQPCTYHKVKYTAKRRLKMVLSLSFTHSSLGTAVAGRAPPQNFNSGVKCFLPLVAGSAASTVAYAETGEEDDVLAGISAMMHVPPVRTSLAHRSPAAEVPFSRMTLFVRSPTAAAAAASLNAPPRSDFNSFTTTLEVAVFRLEKGSTPDVMTGAPRSAWTGELLG